MAVCKQKRTGKNTAEYHVVKEHYSDLVSELQHNLLTAAAEFFSCYLIPDTEVENANNQAAKLFSRATSLMMVVLSSIEHDPTKFVTLTSTLQKVGLSHIASRLTTSMREHCNPTGELNEIPSDVTDSQDSRQANGGVPPPTRSSATFQEVQHQDSSEGGVVLKSTSRGGEASVKDLAYSDDQSVFTTDGDFHGSGDTSGPVDGCSIHTLPVAGIDDESCAPVELSARRVNLEDSNERVVVTPSGSFTLLDHGSEAYRRHHQYQMEIANLEKVKKQQEAEIDCLKVQHNLKDSELSRLRGEMGKKSEEIYRIVKERDDTIEKLKSDQAEKDSLIERLRIEKADIEARICGLKKECAEAVKNQKIAEERAAAVEKEFEEKEKSLNKQLEELREKECKMLLELQTIKTKLAEANGEKLKEMQELKDRNHELELIEAKLQYEVKNQELLKEMELMKTQKELAESRQKCAETELEGLRQKFKNQKNWKILLKILICSYVIYNTLLGYKSHF